MPVSIKFAAFTAATAVFLAATTEAHNKMTMPLPTWRKDFYAQNNPCAFVDPSKVLPVPKGMSYTWDPASNAKAFWTAFNASSFKSVKELIWKGQKLEPGSSKECGFSLVDGIPRDLPDKIQWDFFTASHEGPFEVYCDDTLVFKDWNAAIDFPKTPAETPYDKAKCKGAKMLTSYWLALHTVPWQVYTNCAPLTGKMSSSNSSDSTGSSSDVSQTDPTTPAATPTVTPATPATDEYSSVSQTDVSSEDGSKTTAGEEEDQEETEQEDPSKTDEVSVDDVGSAKVKANSDVIEAEDSVSTTPAPAVEKCTVRRRRRN